MVANRRVKGGVVVKCMFGYIKTSTVLDFPIVSNHTHMKLELCDLL